MNLTILILFSALTLCITSFSMDDLDNNTEFNEDFFSIIDSWIIESGFTTNLEPSKKNIENPVSCASEISGEDIPCEIPAFVPTSFVKRPLKRKNSFTFAYVNEREKKSCNHGSIDIIDENLISISKEIISQISTPIIKIEKKYYVRRTYLFKLNISYKTELIKYKKHNSVALKIKKKKDINCLCYNKLLEFNKESSEKALPNKSTFYIETNEIKTQFPTLYEELKKNKTYALHLN